MHLLLDVKGGAKMKNALVCIPTNKHILLPVKPLHDTLSFGTCLATMHSGRKGSKTHFYFLNFLGSFKHADIEKIRFLSFLSKI